MILGFGKKRIDDDDEEVELVMFQGALNGKEANLAANARLAEAGLIPAKEIVTDALSRRADTIRIEPKGATAAVSLLIDGIAYPGGKLPKQQALAITQIMKLLSGLEIKQRKKRQEGGIKAEFSDTPYEIRVESTPVSGGAERLLIRSRNLNEALNTPEELGFPEEMRTTIREKTGGNKGMVMVCGPPRSGSTTTAFGVLRSVDSYIYTIYSFRDTSSREVSNIVPFEALEGDDLDETFQRCIRVEANIIFLDPITDAETAKVVLKRSNEVSLISEIVAKDAAAGIVQWNKWIEDPQAVSEGLSLMISQKLIRTLCPECKEAFRPNAKLLAKVGLSEDLKTLYRKPRPPEQPSRHDPDPCEKCGDIGYIGRAAMFEMIEMTPTMRELVATNPTPDAVRKQARIDGMRSIQKDGLRLVEEGKTSLEELQRVMKS